MKGTDQSPLNTGKAPKGSLTINLHVDSGAAAGDYAAQSVGKKLDSADLAFKKVHAILKEIDKEVQYLKDREQVMRDVNGEDYYFLCSYSS